MAAVNSLIESCFAVIELLAEEAPSLPLKDIAKRLEVPRSGAQRLMETLVSLGWVERDPDTDRYRLTLRLAVTGQRFLIATKVPDICQPLLDRLAQQTEEFVRMAIVDGDQLTWIAHVQGAQGGLIYQPPIMGRVPLHVTANGKAWLAQLPVEQAIEIVMAKGFGKPGDFGPNAIRSIDALVRELEATRQRGFGLAVEEAERGVVAVAAAIRAPGGETVGTVSVAGPRLRLPEPRIPMLAEQVRGIAAELGMLWPLRILRQQLFPPVPAAASVL
jgi:IclR family transcriptional regulator, acetate operon repressor